MRFDVTAKKIITESLWWTYWLICWPHSALETHILSLHLHVMHIFFFIMWHQYETQLCFLSHERIPVHLSRPCVNIDMKISTDIDSILLVVRRSRCDKLWRTSYVCHFEKHLHRKERNEK